MSFNRQMLVICFAIVMIIVLTIIITQITSFDYNNSLLSVKTSSPNITPALKSTEESRTSSAPAGMAIPTTAAPTKNESYTSETASVFQAPATPIVTATINQKRDKLLTPSVTADFTKEKTPWPAALIKPDLTPSPTPFLTSTPSPTPSPTPTPTPIPEDIAIIDISHRGKGGYAFGVSTDEVKRWQLFTANSYPYLTQVEVRISKWNGTGQSDVIVELYATKDDQPTGFPLATATIPAEYVTKEATIISAPMNYNGLVAGAKYAIVLGQQSPRLAHYIWCTGNANKNYSFGKFDGESGWTDESQLGNGWLEVYVARFPAAINRKPAKPPEIIDISHEGINGYVFGIPRDEVKRWQTFVVNSYSNMLQVKVKVCKWAVTYQSDLLVELYAANNNLPTGQPLMWASVPANFINNDFTVVKVPLTYQGLSPGIYAIVLGQQYPEEAQYRWCIENVSHNLHFGKINENSISIDESWLGNGWLQVYLSK